MNNLRTGYLGLELSNPLIIGASPLTADLDTVREMEDAGAAAFVLPSLFEEQLLQEQISTIDAINHSPEGMAEAPSFFTEPPGLTLGSERYLSHLAQVAEAVDVPVFGSLNGTTRAGWLEYATLMEQAGASGIEMNLFNVATDPQVTAQQIEQQATSLVEEVRRRVQIPLAIKLSPFYTSLPNVAQQFGELGVEGLVLFNRLYQPDIEPETQTLYRSHVADPLELTLRLHWTGVLFGRFPGSLAVSGGVNGARDVVKATMAGASGVQLVSAIMRHGPSHLAVICREISQWLEENEFESLNQMRGSLSMERCPEPHVYTRDNYIQLLQSWPKEFQPGAE